MQKNEKTTETCHMTSQLDEIQRTLQELTKQFYGAFPKDDDGYPDFHGHREWHKEAAAKKKTLSEYQNKFTERIVIGVASATVGLMTIVGTGLGDLIVQIIRGK